MTPRLLLRVFALASSLALVGCGGLGGASRAGAGAVAGTWAGTGQQWDDGIVDGSPDTEWDLRLTLRAARPGAVAGRIDYPSLDCSSTLTFVGAAPAGGPGALLFREDVMEGEANCVDAGDVVLRREGDRLHVEWTYAEIPLVARAVLRREG